MNEKLLDGRTVAILVSNGFDEIEFTDPQKRLSELGATVKVVSRVKNLVNGWYEGNWGHFFPVHADVSDTLAIDFDGLIIPGGIRSVDKLFNDPHGKRILKAFLKGFVLLFKRPYLRDSYISVFKAFLRDFPCHFPDERDRWVEP